VKSIRPIQLIPRHKPIFQCPKGHLICSKCSADVEAECSVCKELLPPTKIRNIIAEKTIEKLELSVPCTHAENGCPFVASKTTLEGHEGMCDWRTVVCPDGDCKEKILFNQLIQHLLEDREESYGCFDVFKMRWTMDEDFVPDSSNSTFWKTKVWKYEGDTFFIVFRMVGGVFHTWVYAAAAAGTHFTKLMLNLFLLGIFFTHLFFF
jgi:hypothetical protein